MKGRFWLCDECRKALVQVGYKTNAQGATHAVDTCDQCKRRTVVLWIEVEKGERDG